MKKIISCLLLLILVLNLGINFVYADENKNPFETVMAEEFTGKENASSIFKIRDTATGKKSLQYATVGTAAYFSGYDFDVTPSKIEAVFGAGADTDFEIEVRADAIDGELIAVFNDTTPSTDTRGDGATYETTVISDIEGIHNIYFVWRTNRIDLFSFKFYPVTTFELVSVSVPEGDIDINTPKISFTFNSNIKESSVEENVNISSGGILKRVKGRTLDIYFSKLESNEDYTITLGNGLCSTTGYSYEGKDFTYHITSTETLEYFEDFTGDEFVVDSAPPASDNYKIVVNYKATDTGNGNALIEEVDGVKCVAISSNTKNVPVTLSIPIKNIDVGEYIELTYKVKIHSPGNASHTLGHIRPASRELISASITGKTITEFFNSFDGSQTGSISYNETDENGFSDVNMKIKRNPVDNYLYIEVYNPQNLSATPFTVYGKAISASEVSLFGLGNVYPIDDAGIQNKMYITDIKYTVKKDFDIAYCFVEDVNIDKEGIDVLFNDTVDESTIDNIKLMCNNIEIPTKKSMNGASVINMEPSVFIKNGEQYSIVIDGVTSTSNKELIKTVTFTADTGNEIASISSNEIRNSSGNITSDKTLADSIKFIPDIELPQDAIILIAAYDSNGSALVAVADDEISGLSNLDWSKIKVSVWQKTDNYYEKIINEPYVLLK